MCVLHGSIGFARPRAKRSPELVLVHLLCNEQLVRQKTAAQTPYFQMYVMHSDQRLVEKEEIHQLSICTTSVQ